MSVHYTNNTLQWKIHVFGAIFSDAITKKNV